MEKFEVKKKTKKLDTSFGNNYVRQYVVEKEVRTVGLLLSLLETVHRILS